VKRRPTRSGAGAAVGSRHVDSPSGHDGPSVRYPPTWTSFTAARHHRVAAWLPEGCSRVRTTSGRTSTLPGGAANLLVRSAPRGIRTPNRQIRSLPVIVRLVGCGPSVLLTSQNLVLPVRLVSCRPPVVLSYSGKNSVNDGLPRVEHQISDLVLQRSLRCAQGGVESMGRLDHWAYQVHHACGAVECHAQESHKSQVTGAQVRILPRAQLPTLYL
jgi:hypothetical protein